MIEDNLRDYAHIFQRMPLHHTGILTGRIPTLPWQCQGRMEVFECDCYRWDQLEFVVPYGGRLLEALHESGPRLHHLAFKVYRLKDWMTILRRQGFLFLLEEPAEGVGNTLVNFVRPCGRGVLIELVEEL